MIGITFEEKDGMCSSVINGVILPIFTLAPSILLADKQRGGGGGVSVFFCLDGHGRCKGKLN